VDSRDIRKHVRDVGRLVRLLTDWAVTGVPDVARVDVQTLHGPVPLRDSTSPGSGPANVN
jgi:hypothetical protein